MKLLKLLETIYIKNIEKVLNTIKNQHILELEAKQQAELAKKQKAEQQAKQQAELQAKQQATIKEEVKLPSSIKNTTSTAPSPKKTHEQEATQELVIYQKNIKEKIEKIKNTASQTMHQKIKIIETKIAMVTTKNSIEKILDAGNAVSCVAYDDFRAMP